jgi:CHASE2 domain-containing sensor protein
LSEKELNDMWKLIIIGVVAWIIGVIGWSQIIGSLQNLDRRKGLLVTLVLWILIMGAAAYVAVAKFNGLWPLAVGYFVSFIQVKAQGRIG